MGLEAMCSARIDGTRARGKALLEGDYLLFRGESARVRVPFSSIRGVEVNGGALVLRHLEGELVLEIGPAAEKWADKIRNPRTLLDKLGVKSGIRVAVIGEFDQDFLAQLSSRTEDVSTGRPRKDTDVIFYAAEKRSALGKLQQLKRMLRPNGAIWVVHRKGKTATLHDVDVFAAGKAAGLVDNKVVGFSPTHTAERLVIPVAKR